MRVLFLFAHVQACTLSWDLWLCSGFAKIFFFCCCCQCGCIQLWQAARLHSVLCKAWSVLQDWSCAESLRLSPTVHLSTSVTYLQTAQRARQNKRAVTWGQKVVFIHLPHCYILKDKMLSITKTLKNFTFSCSNLLVHCKRFSFLNCLFFHIFCLVLLL